MQRAHGCVPCQAERLYPIQLATKMGNYQLVCLCESEILWKLFEHICSPMSCTKSIKIRWVYPYNISMLGICWKRMVFLVLYSRRLSYIESRKTVGAKFMLKSAIKKRKLNFPGLSMPPPHKKLTKWYMSCTSTQPWALLFSYSLPLFEQVRIVGKWWFWF